MTDPTKAFAEVVSRYCEWAESPFGNPLEEMLTAGKFLSELHLFALDLPNVEPETEGVSDLLTSDQWKAVRDRFSSLSVNGYWLIFDPISEVPEEPVYGLLSDDLGDIYRDVKEGLLLFNQGSTVDAVWQWRFDFDHHWGRHLTSAEYAIHSYSQRRKIGHKNILSPVSRAHSFSNPSPRAYALGYIPSSATRTGLDTA